MIIVSWLSDIRLLLGGILTLTGPVGILRLPSFYTRLHGASVTESLAAPLLIIGVMLDTGFTLDSAKLILIIVIMVVANPTITHALCRAAVHGGNTPEMETKSTEKNQSQTEVELSYKETK